MSSDRPKIRVVFDCMVYLQGVARPESAAGACLLLVELEKRAKVISDVPRAFAYERDPKDEPYINLAIAVGASYLVSRDHDTLVLADPSLPNGERLRQQAPGLRILDTVAFLAEIRIRLQGGGAGV